MMMADHTADPTADPTAEPAGVVLPVGAPALEWRISGQPVGYEAALAEMESRIAAIREHGASELVWLLEHPPLYTAGTSAKAADLIDAGGLPVYRTGRGGQFTYHGPGQRVGYVMMDLARRGGDIHRFVRELEGWLIRTLAAFGIRGECRAGRVGVWVVSADGAERKIAAMGLRVRRGVSFHGVALNVDPDLRHFAGIVPCGLRDYGVTSLAAEGVAVSMSQVDRALRATFAEIFER